MVSQNSQLSNKYSAKNYQMKSETQLTEKVDLKRSANHFSMVVPAKSKVKVELINKTTLKKYKLVRKGNTAFYNGKITAGAFQIKVINSTRKSQLCTMISPKSYRLANYAVNGSIMAILFICLKIEDH